MFKLFNTANIAKICVFQIIGIMINACVSGGCCDKFK